MKVIEVRTTGALPKDRAVIRIAINYRGNLRSEGKRCFKNNGKGHVRAPIKLP